MRSPLIFLAVGATLALASCAPSTSNGPDPDAVDPAPPTDGLITEVEGTSPFETDKWVIAARAEDTGYLQAVNALDFSLPAFTETHTDSDAQLFYQFFIDEFVTGGAPVVMFAGPSIRLPLEVVENDTGDQATIRFCDASVDWAISKEFPEPSYDLKNGQEMLVLVVVDDATGDLVWGGEQVGGAACDATGAPVQKFDPQPVVPESLALDDVTPPAS